MPLNEGKPNRSFSNGPAVGITNTVGSGKQRTDSWRAGAGPTWVRQGVTHVAGDQDSTASPYHMGVQDGESYG